MRRPADGNFSHDAQKIAGFQQTAAGEPARPSNSLISTAVQPAAPLQRAAKLQRANSVASQSEAPAAAGRKPAAPRAATPASVYGQGSGDADGPHRNAMLAAPSHAALARHLTEQQVCFMRHFGNISPIPLPSQLVNCAQHMAD